MARRSRYKIGAIKLDVTISKLLETYGQDVHEVLYDGMKTASDLAVQKLQAVNRFSPNGHPTGAYSKDWTKTEQQTSRLSKQIVVHNEDHYRLTHLLENGHALKRGGRTYGSVPAYPHIYPVEQEVIKVFEDDVIERLLNTFYS